MVPSFFLRQDQIIYCTLTSTRFEFLAFCRLVCMSIQLIDFCFGFSWSWILCRNHSHDLVSELPEQSTLQGFGHEVSDHVSGWTPDQWYVALVDSIGNKEVPNIDMLRMLAARSLSILFQKNCALVVLEQNIVLNLVSLLGWASMKYWVQQITGMKSSAPTISDSIELWVLSLCLVELTMGNPLPKDRPPPLCPCILGWTANATSTHHFIMPVPLALRISGSMHVLLRYFIRWTSLFQSSLLGARTLGIKNAIAVQVVLLIWGHIVSWPPGCETLATAFSGGSFGSLPWPWREHQEQCSPKSFRDTCGLCLCWLSFVLIHPQRYFHILAWANQSCYH